MLCLHDNDLEELLNFFNEFAAQGPLECFGNFECLGLGFLRTKSGYEDKILLFLPLSCIIILQTYLISINHLLYMEVNGYVNSTYQKWQRMGLLCNVKKKWKIGLESFYFEQHWCCRWCTLRKLFWYLQWYLRETCRNMQHFLLVCLGWRHLVYYDF